MSETSTNIKIKLFCNWTSCYNLIEEFKKYFKDGYTYDNLDFVLDNQDFNVVINYTLEPIDLKKTILFQWEPKTTRNNWPSFWSNPNISDFLKAFTIETHHNILCWYFDKTYKQLKTEPIQKTKIMSGIVSNLSNLEGHIHRKNFVDNYLLGNSWYDHFGRGYNEINDKSLGLYPYKYTFACENSFEPNYFTEKIVDAFMSETLCFYDGCPNIESWFNPNSFIRIDVRNPRVSFDIIKDAIFRNAWENQLHYIQHEKEKILKHTNWIEQVKGVINEKC